jgi:hypothetical protein
MLGLVIALLLLFVMWERDQARTDRDRQRRKHKAEEALRGQAEHPEEARNTHDIGRS